MTNNYTNGTVGGYDTAAAWDRLGTILDREPFEETDTIPTTVHGPGAAVRGTVIFVDVRDSTGLIQRARETHLARLYRALITELSTALTHPLVRHIGTTGDRVWAVYDTPTGTNAAAVLDLVARVNALRSLINRPLHQHQNEAVMIEYGIGVEYGPLVMINTDPTLTTGGNVAYAGEAMQRAAELAHHAARQDRLPVDIGAGFVGLLDDDQREVLDSVFQPDPDGRGYNGNLVDGTIYEAVGRLGEPADGPG